MIAGLLTAPAWAASVCDSHGESRPSIGLALSGGGARGAAHIGVLKVLEELRVPIDCIAGTSMGAIIGGLYASGLTTADLERAIAEIDWAGVFDDQPSRDERTFRRKSDDLLFLIKKKARVKDGEVKVGHALIQGQKFDLELSRLTLQARNIRDFDQLRIPFRAVATNIATGKEVVLGKGNLPTALRASMAVPAAFAAVEIDGHLLVDGGIANNLPINVVRRMGADVVIAVDISTPLRGRGELGSALGILHQLSGLLTRRTVEQQLATLTERDVLLVPTMGGVGSTDFDLIGKAVPTGVVAANAKREALRRYAQSGDDYARSVAARGGLPAKHSVPVIEFVRIDNDSTISDDSIKAHMNYPLDQPLDVSRLESGIGRVYGMDAFESVRYRVVEERGVNGVVVTVREKSWGTDSLQLGLESSADFDGDSFFNIGGAYTMAPLNRLNGEWRTIIGLGEEPSFVTEIYQPLDAAEHWFLSGGVMYETRSVKLFDQHQAVGEYDLSYRGVRLGAGYNFDTSARIELALRRMRGDADIAVGGLPEFDFDLGEVELGAVYDSVDNFYFPRHGSFGVLAWRGSRAGLGADDDFDQYELGLGSANSWGDHTLLGGVRLQTTAGDDAPIQRLFTTGGFLRLSGLQQGELSGQHAGLLFGGYLYRLSDKLVPVYLGASLELGNAWQDEDDIALDDTILAGSVFVGADTFFGPLYFALGHAEGGESAAYLFLGQPWFEL